MGTDKKGRMRLNLKLRFVWLLSLTLLGVFLFLYVSSSSSSSSLSTHNYDYDSIKHDKTTSLPPTNDLSVRLQKLNRLPPRNTHLFPTLPAHHIPIVLYVHNRPHYLQLVIDSLSRVRGINETLLIVSHDGYFQPMNAVVDAVRFCQVKPIFAPYSPHVFPDAFPGASADDCVDKRTDERCVGDADQYGNHRSPKIVSLKHHWWWMMNTVWDGLNETSDSDHLLFIEEDHYIYPNAYRNLQKLLQLKPLKCPDCYAVNLAPCDVNSRGEGWDCLVAERIGNVGYAFNRTVWRKIHSKAQEFCRFDDYNWDITMWAKVYPSFGDPVYTLRGPRTSAVHFGKCGLHQGQGGANACIDNGIARFSVDKRDETDNLDAGWGVHYTKDQPGYKAGFKGWGGWADRRDHRLCLNFARMYHPSNSNQLT